MAAIFKTSLKDNQEYWLAPHDSWGVCLQSDYNAPVQLPKKGWDSRSMWLQLEDKLLASFSQSKLLVVSEEPDYEHTTATFFQTGWKKGSAFSVLTGNLIGCVRFGNLELEVTSRFGNYFLQYIITDADGFVPISELGGETDLPSGYQWLLAFLWSSRLRRAYRLGMPKKYLTECETLGFIRGEISPVDYYVSGTIGKWKCTYRNLSYNTLAAELICAAYHIIRTKAECAFACSGVHNIYQTFMQATIGKRSRRKELLDVPYFTNSFYMEYNRVIDLSKLILRYWGSEYSGADDSEAIFFDVAMLFEFYVRKLLIRNGFSMRRKEDTLHYIPTIPMTGNYSRKLIPDLVFELSHGIGVFDVIYKSYDTKYGVSRDDLFQLHTYIGQYGNETSVSVCGFVYPIKESRRRTLRSPENTEQVVLLKQIRQQNKDIPFAVGFIVIPDNSTSGTWHDFNIQMTKWASLFIEQMKHLTDGFKAQP